MDNSKNPSRINDILLGPLERPALQWLAAHSPTWMTPDIYTIIGILGGVIIFWGYLLSRFHPAFFWLATFGYLVNWFGDSLDGTLARYRHIERPVYGFYVDHVSDAATQVIIFVGLGLSPHVSFNVAILTLVMYLLMSILVYVRTCTFREFKISYGKLGPTEARVLAVLLNIAMFIFGEYWWRINLGPWGNWTFSPYDVYVAAIGLLLLYFFISTTIPEVIRLGKDPQ